MLVVETHNESAGPYQGFGTRYEQRISEHIVRKHFGGSLRPGWQRDVRSVTDATGFHLRLSVANISGAYFLRSAGVQVPDWPEVFGVRCAPEALAAYGAAH